MVAKYICRNYRNPRIQRAMLAHDYLSRDGNANFRHFLALAKAKRRTSRELILELSGRPGRTMKPARALSDIMQTVLQQLTPHQNAKR